MRSRTITFVLALCMLFSLHCGAETRVGEVIFAVGDAHFSHGGEAIKRSQALDVGQTIVTGTNGHVHVRFLDDAFVSVRPNSQLTIERYDYDIKSPAKNQVKFTLQQGTARLITGKAGQTNKQGFRLNTPVAAIGIRGTDFVVQAGPDATRVAVHQGGIQVTPFGADCLASGLAACQGRLTRDLAGSFSGDYLEVRGQNSPELVLGGGKQPFALPRPEEPAVQKNTSALPPPPGFGGSSALMWGRWSASSATPLGYDLVGQNEAFTLYRLNEVVVLPTSGAINFNLRDSVIYGRHTGQDFQPATIANPTFAVNFNAMTFSTRFDWTFEGKTKTLQGVGNVQANGRFGTSASAPLNLSGALTDDAQSASYIFSRSFPTENIRAYGVMDWQR